MLLRLIAPLLSRIDSSREISKWLDRLSSSMATQRGLLLLIGTILLMASLFAHAITIILLVSAQTFSGSLYWLCIPFSLMHAGVMVGFIGIMLATPLGQGYKDNK